MGPYTWDQCRLCWLALNGHPTEPAPARPAPRGGPGTELAALVAKLGLKREGCVPCQDWAGWMDALGAEGCRQNEGAIVARLRAEQAQLGWGEYLAAAAALVREGLAGKVNPLDPAPGLLEEAIGRAAAKAAPPAPGA